MAFSPPEKIYAKTSQESISIYRELDYFVLRLSFIRRKE